LSDDIELIIQRDLDRLPVFSEERWVPKAGASKTGFPQRLRAPFLVVAIVLALALGSALTFVRDQLSSVASASLRPTPAKTSLPASGFLPRQIVLAHVRLLTGLVPRAQRFEAKLVSSADVSANLAAPGGRDLWVVAVSGDVNCSFCPIPPAQPLHSALFWFDAETGNVLGSAQGPAIWPENFDALPDRSRSSGSRTLVGTIMGVSGDVVEFQAVGSSDRLRLAGDKNTAYAWTAGPVGHSVVTIDELAIRSDLLSAVTFDPIPLIDGSYRLESLTSGLNTN
jgi:hypothetical protein